MSGARILTVGNVNTALEDGLYWLRVAGVSSDSRNGPVLRAPGPVVTEFLRPRERVLFSPLRDANPFFHLYECIWMLAGRNDSASVARYAQHMDSFAENGIMNGAYGHRWRAHFGYDQLLFIAEELKRDLASRRCVLTMWDAGHDPGPEATAGYMVAGDPHKARAGSKDVPCNTHVYFEIQECVLNMTVCNRSNDVVWGAYGANAVHMSFLQEVMAAAVGVAVGTYWQVSNNYHIYTDRADVERLFSGGVVHYQKDDRYECGVSPYPIDQENFQLYHFLVVCGQLAEQPCVERGRYGFLSRVFVPMMRAHRAHKEGHTELALDLMTEVLASDWRTAGTEWLQRRLDKQRSAA